MDVALDESIKTALEIIQSFYREMEKRVIGQRDVIEGVLMGLIAGGHILIEGVPGLAKTVIVKTVADIIDASFKRIQFTPDLLPADLIGTMVYRQHTGEFTARKGPIFSNIILADEINRAPAKVQSALLEAMQERQVTIGENTYPLTWPFFVLATQNPIEQEGTYPLPEAQLDRFLLKLLITYPKKEEEVEILQLKGSEREIPVDVVLKKKSLKYLIDTQEAIQIDKQIQEYIVALVSATREKKADSADFVKYIEYGASPRASIYLYRCSRVKALFSGRTFVLPEDVKAVAHNVLRHSIILTYEAESEELSTDDIIDELLNFVYVP
jgi:MoxR-like ATPase